MAESSKLYDLMDDAEKQAESLVETVRQILDYESDNRTEIADRTLL